MKIFGSWSELLQIVWRKNSQNVTLRPNQATTYTASRDIQLPPGDADHVIVSASSTQTLTNKTIDADGTGNSISNIDDGNIKAAAGIDATKIADGSVSNAEFQALNGVSGTLVTTAGTQTLSNKSLVDNSTAFVDSVDPTIQVDVAANGLAGTKTTVVAIQTSNRTITLPDASDTLVGKATTDIFTNKTIDGDTNTVQDLPITAIKTVLGDANKVLRRDASGIAQSGNTLPNTDPIVTTTATQTLSAKTLSGADADFVEYNDQGSDPSTPAGSGDVRLYAKDDKLYTKNSLGTVTEVGAGSGSGGINYIDNGAAEVDTTGWATYADAAGTVPVDGTGGSANVLFTRNTTTPLRSPADFKLAKDAANRQGQGVSYDFSIDSADVSKALQISCDFNYDGTYAAGDIGCYVYDVTNSTLLYTGSPNLAAGKYTYQTTFNATTSTSYRLIFHVASTSASAYNIYLDNVQVGPVIAALGAAQSDWASFTPTLSGAFGAATSVLAKWRQQGSNMQVSGSFTGGAAGASLGAIQIPAGYNIDSTALTRSNNDTTQPGNVVGWISQQSGVSPRSANLVTCPNTSTLGVYVAGGITSGNHLVPVNIGTTFDASSNFSFYFEVPIAQWASASVYLSQATPEYASNTSVTDADDTTSFANGPAGNLVPTIVASATSATRTKRVRFLTPIQPTDRITVQIQNSGSGEWIDIGQANTYGNYNLQNNAAYGVGHAAVSGSTTDVDVLFYRGGLRPNGLSYGSTGQSYPNNAADRWRAVKIPGTVQVASPVTVKYQKKTNSANVSGTGVISDLTFNNLTIGKTYRVSGQIQTSETNTTANAKNIVVEIKNGSTNLQSLSSYQNTGAGVTRNESVFPVSRIFVATATTVTTEITTNTNMLLAGENFDENASFVILEELSTHVVTTEFT